MELAKAQRNAIFHGITIGRLNPLDCILAEDEWNVISIAHSPTDSMIWFGFAIYPSKPQRGVARSFIRPPIEIDSIAYQMKLGSDPRLAADEIRSWEAVLAKIQEWAEAVIEWCNIPDLWNMKADWERLTVSRAGAIENTPFTQEEIATVADQLAAIKREIGRTYSLTNEQLTVVEARIDEVKEASRRIARKDWILLFAGTVFSLILVDAITPEIAQHILIMIAHGLSHLFSGETRPISG
jgi:hypothetical protein